MMAGVGASDMSNRCTACGKRHASYAPYCRRCGRPLAGRGADGRVGVRLAVVAALLLAGTCGALAGVAVALRGGVADEGPVVQRIYHCSDSKQGELYRLLQTCGNEFEASLSGEGLRVRTREARAEALDALAELVTRLEGLDRGTVEARMQAARAGWVTEESYRLPAARARALFDVLDDADVPVLVSWSGLRITVRATGADQQAVAGFVAYLKR